MLGTFALALASAACGRSAEATWPTGILRYEGQGRVGDEDGEWVYYYADGQIRERGRWESGRRAGRWTQWWPNGQRASEGERVYRSPTHASEREGAWVFWHTNGQQRAAGSYREGLREGPWSFWKEDGAVDEQSGAYEHGLPIR